MRESLNKLERGSVSEDEFTSRKDKCKTIIICISGIVLIMGISITSFFMGINYSELYLDNSDSD
jgi:hypothetical protein